MEEINVPTRRIVIRCSQTMLKIQVESESGNIPCIPDSFRMQKSSALPSIRPNLRPLDPQVAMNNERISGEMFLAGRPFPRKAVAPSQLWSRTRAQEHA
ncbi:hypothetical protein ACRE_017110 [Hapsidospora chrysogenum ATCC 11550]|uniref:Uncharacterized protein n=1 Tax=Hapsidospora chrysogenum (strain ATCC 11550 / CBS 779.69 / DSM 880 / IAM 14645 / JCM 23072 / IMI 49137) TaxID=857340 RepID=A0A086TDL8_HAPC1|nr:hypothetical protein ACRE_017110 [Hapsidospora chrysogenum ATCC 11550]